MSLMKKLTSLLLASSLILSLVGTAFASYGPAGVTMAADRMVDLGIVEGRGGGDLALNSNITRAELVTIIVRAYGQDSLAKLVQGSTGLYTDVSANQWYTGYVALSKNIIEGYGLEMGYPDGSFKPNGNVTSAEAIAFLLKFLGVQFNMSTTAWPDGYLDVAVSAGIITADDKAVILPIKNSAATRGLVFYLADQSFYNYQMASSGQSLYTTYVDATAPVLSVDALDATTTAAQVTVSGSASDNSGVEAVYVNSVDNMALQADGKWSANIDLQMGANSIEITAVDLAGNVSSQTVSISRTAGAAAAIEAPASITVEAGATAEVEATVVDKDGNEVAGEVVMGESDLGTYADGVFTAGTEAGTGTLDLTHGPHTYTVNVTVEAGALAKIAVSPATVDLSAGGSQQFTATGSDEHGNEVALTAAVVWSADKGVMGADGTYGATSSAAGTATITATSGSVSGTATANIFGAAAKLTAAAPASLIANGKSTTQLVVTAQDANGNTARNFNGTISFVNNNSTIVGLSAGTATAVNGVATIDLTAGSAVGTSVISISSTGLTGTTVMATTTAQAATSVELKADPATVAADNTSTITVTAVMMDQTGNAMTSAPSGTWTIDFANSASTIVSPASASATFSVVSGKFQASSTFTAKNNLGAATISGTVKLNGTASSTVTANAVSVSTALVGVPYKLSIDATSEAKAAGTTGTTQNVVVRVLDVNGNQVTGAVIGTLAGQVNVTLAENSATAAIGTQTNSGGKASFAVTNTKAETVTYTATAAWSGNTLVKAEATGTFVPGPANKVTLTTSPGTISASGSATSTLTAKIADANSNPVTSGTYAVTFKRTVNNSAVSGFSNTTVNSVDGVASMTVTGSTTLATDSFTAEAVLSGTSATVSTAATVQTLIMGVPNQLKFAATTAAAAGAEATIKVEVHDAAGTSNVVTSDNGTVVTLVAKKGTSIDNTYTATAVNGVATFKVTLTSAGAYTLSATSSGLKGAGVTGGNTGATQTINAGVATGISVSANVSTLGADGASKAATTIKMVDAHGNVTEDGDLHGLTVTSGTPAVGTVPASPTFYKNSAATTLWVNGVDADSLKESAKIDVTATTTPGSTVVTAKKGTLTDGTLSINTMVVGAPAKLMVEVGDSKKVSITGETNLQEVKVTVQDANGNRVTNATNHLKLSTSAGTGTIVIYTDAAGTVAQAAPLTPLAAGDAGQKVFYVKNSKAESVTYKAEATTDNTGGTVDTAIATASASGSFTNNVANSVDISASPAYMAGNGSNISVVTAKVVDEKNNTVIDATGSVKFQVAPAAGFTHAFIQGAGSDGWYTASVSNGQAIAIVQSRSVTSPFTGVQLSANYWKADATSVTIAGGPTAVINIGDPADTAAPTVTSAVAANGTGTATTIDAGDTITFTFNENTNKAALNNSSFTTTGGRTFGENATFVWTNHTTLVVTLGTATGGHTLIQATDTVAFSSGTAVQDWSGNGFGTGTLLTVPAAASF